MVHIKGLTQLSNLYVSETEVTAKGLALVPRKDRMVMMRVGKAALSAKQIDKMMKMYPVPRDANLRPERLLDARAHQGGDDRTREGCQLNRRAQNDGSDTRLKVWATRLSAR